MIIHIGEHDIDDETDNDGDGNSLIDENDRWLIDDTRQQFWKPDRRMN